MGATEDAALRRFAAARAGAGAAGWGTNRALKLAALAAIVAVAAGWIVYADIWRNSGPRPLAYRDVTSQLRGLEPDREAERLFVKQRQLDEYVRFADPGHVLRQPRFDFASDEALLVAAGPRSSTGYSIRIVRAVEERGRIAVTVREETPALRNPGRPEVTYPYRLLVFRKVDKPVYLNWQGRP